MLPVTASTTIDRPRAEVFEYLCDIANFAEFSDHYLSDWHLTREDTYGVGAGVRYRQDMPLNRFGWGDLVIVEAQAPYRLLLHGRGGKYNRIRMVCSYTLEPGENDSTKLTYRYETEPDQLSDKLLEGAVGHGWQKRNSRKAVKRLRAILEDGKRRGKRVTVEGPRTPEAIRPLATPPSTPHR